MGAAACHGISRAETLRRVPEFARTLELAETRRRHRPRIRTGSAPDLLSARLSRHEFDAGSSSTIARSSCPAMTQPWADPPEALSPTVRLFELRASSFERAFSLDPGPPTFADQAQRNRAPSRKWFEVELLRVEQRRHRRTHASAVSRQAAPRVNARRSISRRLVGPRACVLARGSAPELYARASARDSAPRSFRDLGVQRRDLGESRRDLGGLERVTSSELGVTSPLQSASRSRCFVAHEETRNVQKLSEERCRGLPRRFVLLVAGFHLSRQLDRLAHVRDRREKGVALALVAGAAIDRVLAIDLRGLTVPGGAIKRALLRAPAHSSRRALREAPGNDNGNRQRQRPSSHRRHLALGPAPPLEVRQSHAGRDRNGSMTLSEDDPLGLAGLEYGWAILDEDGTDTRRGVERLSPARSGPPRFVMGIVGSATSTRPRTGDRSCRRNSSVDGEPVRPQRTRARRLDRCLHPQSGTVMPRSSHHRRPACTQVVRWRSRKFESSRASATWWRTVLARSHAER